MAWSGSDGIAGVGAVLDAAAGDPIPMALSFLELVRRSGGSQASGVDLALCVVPTSEDEIKPRRAVEVG